VYPSQYACVCPTKSVVGQTDDQYCDEQCDGHKITFKNQKMNGILTIIMLSIWPNSTFEKKVEDWSLQLSTAFSLDKEDASF
jgi:hypothetical protein